MNYFAFSRSSEDPDLRKLMHKTIPDDPQIEPPIPFDVGTMSFAGELCCLSYGGRHFWSLEPRLTQKFHL